MFYWDSAPLKRPETTVLSEFMLLGRSTEEAIHIIDKFFMFFVICFSICNCFYRFL